ncbi:MAG: cytochrome c oxidase subunit II [Chloroflexi bacterium]|nr:cytochrome c oxidase subunit II [Chloroflexota bacterium]MCH8349655.1 cytochrome c oxidase subunit II [Chloroflexota bacterium]MCI0781943.1 cytochrome c oxidase subunit II [Chloroflexota bacterium]MCI0793861.1 cytochrome c oxidase subunit II [Chloroflexota bacterium]MCI0799482.1 cytochrome c oxidase subunit II [Chloroflexota bacterium]
MPDISTHGFWIDWSLGIITVVTVLVAILSFALIAMAMVNFRQRKNPTATRHMSGWITRFIILDIIMIIFDIVISVYSTIGWTEIMVLGDETLIRKHGEAVHVNVVARQFFWAFNYPGADATFGTADDFTLANQLVVPENKLVLLALTAGDTIHSFAAPHLRIKYDVIPGRETRVWFKATQTGEYPAMCTELCGLGHFQMIANINVLSQPDYARWLETRTLTVGAP